MQKRYIYNNGSSSTLKKMSGNFTINTESIVKIEKENYQSYTFFIQRNNQEKHTAENLVIENKQDTIRGFIVKYNFSKEYIAKLNEGIQIPFQGTVQRTVYKENLEDLLDLLSNKKSSKSSYKSSGQYCIKATYVGERLCKSLDHGVIEDPTNLCGYTDPKYRAAYYVIRVVTDCFNDYYSTSLSDEQEVIDTLGDDYAGSGPSTTTTTTQTTINIPCTTNCNTSTLANDISRKLALFKEQEDWLEEQSGEFLENIDKFCESNPNSTEAENFAREAINAKMENNDVDIDFDDQIINKLTGKAKCVFEKLDGNDLINKTIQRFDNSNLVDLLIKYGSMQTTGASGETDYGYPITITLNKDHIEKRPSLYSALVILHEGIHAEIYRKIITRSKIKFTPPNNYTLPDGSRADFPTLFDYYDNHPDNPHHNYMADYYRDAIEKGLKDYATKIGKTYPDQLYKDLAWGGLHGTKAWDNMFADQDFTKKEQSRIIKSINQFIKSGTNDCK